MGFRFRKSKKIGAFRVNFSKSGIGFSVGSKGLRYTHSATGRKSVRTTLPGTGISYETSLSNKRTKSKKSNRSNKKKITTMGNNNTKKSNGKTAAIVITGVLCIGGISSLFDSQESPSEISDTAGVSREIIESIEIEEDPETILSLLTDTPEPETEIPVIETESITEETYYIETETAPPETVPQETETLPPETLPPETVPPETEPETEAYIYIPEETEPPETIPPETEPPIVIVHDDSTFTVEMVDDLEGIAFFWAPTGDKVHLDPTCRSFKKGYTFAGTLEQAQSVRTEGWCGTCSKSAGDNTTTNPIATKQVLAACYSYNDFLNGIPAEAFE